MAWLRFYGAACVGFALLWAGAGFVAEMRAGCCCGACMWRRVRNLFRRL